MALLIHQIGKEYFAFFLYINSQITQLSNVPDKPALGVIFPLKWCYVAWFLECGRNKDI